VDIEGIWYCGYCGEENSTDIDMNLAEQQFIEDCSACCNPNSLHVVVDQDNEDVDIDAEYDG